MHHKRKKPKSGRAGCLMCKSHKHQGSKKRLCNQTHQEKLSRISENEQVRDVTSRHERHHREGMDDRTDP